MAWNRRGFVAFLAAILSVALLRPNAETVRSMAADPAAGPQLVIDAGHGGEDGGAVSLTGAPESQINLAIALKLDALLGLYGQPPILTRSSDCSLHSDDAVTLRQKKVSDLHHRAALINGVNNPVLISIHQNTYPNPRYHGAQVFYRSPESLCLAQTTQELLCRTLDPGNTRAPARIADSIYLMKHVSCPAVLVECGFLSNPREEALLRTEDHQKKLAAVLAASWLQYQQQEMNKEDLSPNEG